MKQEGGHKVGAVMQQKGSGSGVDPPAAIKRSKVVSVKREDELVKQRKREVVASVFGNVTSDEEVNERVDKEVKEKRRIKLKRPKFEF